MKQINIGIIGFGNIGSAVVKNFKKKNRILNDKTVCRLRLKAVCDKNPKVFRGSGLSKAIIKRKASDILNDPSIHIVIELIGGIHPAKEIIIQALKKGKHVITANKALLADHKDQFIKIAKQKKVSIYFEASVLAAVPIIEVIRECLMANEIKSIWGIVNGTSNYILSNMHNYGLEFKEALKKAQKMGFAEKKYSLDVEGTDSAHKLAIISSLAFRQNIKLNDIHIEGISRISLGDIMYAKELGYTIKLLAIAKSLKGSIEVRVQPTLLPQDHLLSKVDGAYNAVYIQADLVKDLFLYGEGAGKEPTSSAVIDDISDVVSDMRKGSSEYINFLATSLRKTKRIKKIGEIESRYYIRFMAVDKPGVLAKISGILGKHKISIASVIQKARRRAQAVPIIMLTHQAKESDLKKALAEIDKLSAIRAKSVAIMIEQES